jgi:protein TonB
MRLGLFFHLRFHGSRMSKDPNTNPPPNGKGQESLEDLIYRPSLSETNKSLKGANPFVSAACTLLFYGIAGSGLYYIATRTTVGKAVVKKTVGIDLQEEKEDIPPPPPPPPPPPMARPMPKIEVKETAAPPPPLVNPDAVPDFAPKEMPKQDLSLAYGGRTGKEVADAVAAAAARTPVSTVAKVMDFSYDQMKVKFKPPPPAYPPIARMAKIQGTVVVEIIVGVDGVPVSAKAIEGPPQLRPVSENYAMQWRFEPAVQNGQPVQAKFRLSMPFKLQ